MLHFSCTLCGKCCHNHSLPLTMGEAIAWLEDKGVVAIYCEAIHLVSEPFDARAKHRKQRGFAVPCGSSTLHVTAILVAVISGPCLNLGADMKCTIYERRPLVCRIYPAEISPFIELDPANKVCPPEAWLPSEPADNEFAQLLPSLAEKSRRIDYAEATRKGLVCLALGINTTALADEGYVRHMPEPTRFLAALKEAFEADPQSLPPHQPWIMYSASLTAAQSQQGLDVICENSAEASYQFLRA